MKSVKEQSLDSLSCITDALDAQQEAVGQLRETLSTLVSQFEELAAGAAQYGDSLSYAYDQTEGLGEECRLFPGPALDQAA